MYLTYEEYQNMGGTLDETTFNDYGFEAEAKVNWYTFNRLKNNKTYPEEVKRCVYRLIKLIEDANKAMVIDGTGENSSGMIAGIASQSNDGVSISYNTLSAKDMLDASQAQVEITIRQYLSYVTNELGKKLLYRGMYPDE